MKKNTPLSLYVHIPFCQKKCDYCDFNSFVGNNTQTQTYIDALIKEVDLIGEKISGDHDINTIFFGGGTPTVLSIRQVESIVDKINNRFLINPQAEISIESNPGTIDEVYLKNLKALGFNRISFGFQSTNDVELTNLGRLHNRKDAFNSVRYARNAGFENINVDLIYGIPKQTISNWVNSLSDVIDLQIEHISMYELSFEPGTIFYKKEQRGEIEPISSDITAKMYEIAREKMSENGYCHYEISNWAKEGYECRHNKQYWYAEEYIGLGLGAHSHYNNHRFSNHPYIDTYNNSFLQHKTGNRIQKNGYKLSNAVIDSKILSERERMQEKMMLGLRMTEEGVSVEDFRNRFKESPEHYFRKEIDELLKSGLITFDSGRLILTERGQLLGNQVFMKFVD